MDMSYEEIMRKKMLDLIDEAKDIERNWLKTVGVSLEAVPDGVAKAIVCRYVYGNFPPRLQAFVASDITFQKIIEGVGQ